MSTNVVNPPFPRFDGLDGQPLENGMVWVGVANMDAPSNPIAVFWDAALTISAAQPIRTVNGYYSRDGSPGVLFAGSDYSIEVTTAVGVPVYSVPARVDSVVTDVVISSGESLIVESGGTIEALDGSVTKIGDNTGVGAHLEFASNARVVGNVVPHTDGSQTLGTVNRRWDAFLGDVQVLGNITPPTGLPGDLNVGSNTLPAGNVVSQTMRADDLTIYRTAQPSSITDYAGLAKINARTTVLALARQTSTNPAVLESNEAYNIAFITTTGGSQPYTVQFTTNVPLNAIPLVTSQGSAVSGKVVIDGGGGGYTATVTMLDAAGATVSSQFSLVVFGAPSATGAAGIVTPIL